jgi:hypothetical protein
MKRVFTPLLALVLVIGLMPTLAFAADYQSGDKVTTPNEENTLNWTGQGATGGELDTVECDQSNTGYLLWVFTYDGGDQAYNGTTPYLVLNDGMGPYYPTKAEGNEFHFETPYYTPDSSLEAVVHFYTVETGNGAYNLVISHGCPGGGGGQAQATLSVIKFYDANANGTLDEGEQTLDDWYFTIDGDLYSTPFSEIIDAGTYNITECMPIEPSWVASGITVDGTEDYNIVSDTEVEVTLVDEDDVTIYFGNYCLRPSGGKTLGFWSNKNGQATMNDGGTMAPELAMLTGLNLRKANGADFNPATYAAFKTWLLSATATNMAYMLSAQLAAMDLNVEAGLVNGDAFYIPYGGTINQLMTAANNALGADGYTPAGDPNRSTQETLKNYLDALNNGASVVNPTPCTYTFP